MDMNELQLIVNGLVLALQVAKEVHELMESQAIKDLENKISILIDFIERKKTVGLSPILEDIAPVLDDTAHNNE
jgi:predicted transcriptional regulator